MLANTRIEELGLMQKNFFRMHHIGELLKEALTNSRYPIKEIAEQMDVAPSTIFRWYNVPNLPIKHIAQVNAALPDINLKKVYESLEENLGQEIFENPYRKEPVIAQPKGSGITIQIDYSRYAGYQIPQGLEKMVEEAIEAYNREKNDQ